MLLALQRAVMVHVVEQPVEETTVADVLINGAGTRRDHGALSLVGGDDPTDGHGANSAKTNGQNGSGHSTASEEASAVSVNGANTHKTQLVDASSTGPRYQDIAIDAIRRNPRNPRSVFDEDALVELTHSIREFGLLQPIVVREVPGGGFELVMGERRWRAAERAGLDTIPAIVAATYQNLDPRLRGAAALSVFAHLEDLVARGLVATQGAPRLDGTFAAGPSPAG